MHRSTALVLIVSVVGTGAFTVFTRNVVEHSEHRLLQQKAGAAAIILNSLLSQSYAPAVQGLAAAVKPTGAVDQATFRYVSAALQTPEPTAANQQGGMGANAVALLDLSNGSVLASAGTPALDLTSKAGATALAAAAKAATNSASHAAFVGLFHQGASRSLGMLALAGTHAVSYLEVPFANTVDVGAIEQTPQYNQAFGGLDFAMYYGKASLGTLMMTNDRDRHLDGYVARVYVGMGSDNGYSGTSYDAGQRPLQVAMEARQPMVGAFAHMFPWLMLAFGLLTGLAVMVLTEKTQRRKDEAFALVNQLEDRNAEFEEAVNRRQQAEEQLRQSQRLEAVGQLAGGIAHDFNNLLAVIFSYTGFLRNAADGQPWAEDVEEIDRAAHRAADLTQQLLMFSRREDQRSSVIDLRALINDRCRLLRRTLSEDIDVQLDLPDSPVRVRADEVELDQVIMNLVVNARDAMPSGGTLRLVLSEQPGQDGDSEVELCVCDTGTGMSEEVLKHAFEPFFTTKEVGRGTGLGLASVYGIATRWGGSVHITSTTGEGTQVTVRLPGTREAVEPVAAALVPAARTAVETTAVLLVEDDPNVARANHRILTEAGFDVVVASTGPEAVELFADHEFDVLVSDVVMPGGLSGPEVVEQLRLQRPGLPAVLVSGHSRDHLTRRGTLPVGVKLLRKPFAAAELVEATRRCLEGEGVSP